MMIQVNIPTSDFLLETINVQTSTSSSRSMCTSAQSGQDSRMTIHKPMNAQLDWEALNINNMFVNTLNRITMEIEHELLNFTL